MIWRLFKPKPTFVLTIPHTMTKEELDEIKAQVKKEMGMEYNVIVLSDSHKTYIETKVLNNG
jgi:3'-phosphoadenosine 5'-phosphosulfate sulfotransferase (PAPS reductase)/FAD synthetase